MRLCRKEANASNEGCARTLEVSVLKIGTRRIAVQTRDPQRSPVPWDPSHPEEAEGSRARIIDGSASPAPTSHLQVVDASTGDLVREAWQSEPRIVLTILS